MNGSMRILVDECISPRVMETVNSILSHFEAEAAKFTTLAEFMGKHGEKDSVWIPKAREAAYMVISGDLGRRKVGDKLPEICEKNGVKHILVSAALKDQGQLAIAMGIFGLWRSIRLAWSEAEALRYTLQLRSIDSKHEVGTTRPALMRQRREGKPNGKKQEASPS